MRIIGKKEVIKVEVPRTRYRRYEWIDSRHVRIDFRCITSNRQWKINYTKRSQIKWNNPEHLRSLINEYFASCEGLLINPKTGLPLLDANGKNIVGVVKPYTISGLARALGIHTITLRKYERGRIDELGFPTDEDYVGPQYSDIVFEARQRIEEFAEQKMYDRDGFNGGKHVLDVAFNWQGRKEAADTQSTIEMTKLRREEFEFKKENIAAGVDSDEPINITITRAAPRGGNDES